VFVAVILVVVSFISWLRQKKHLELFVGFWLILTFSDSALFFFQFAPVVKAVVAVIVAFVLFTQAEIKYGKFFFAFLPFFLYALLISSLHQASFFISVQKILSYFILILVVPSFMAYLRKQDEDRLFQYLMYTGFGVLAVSLLLLIVYPPWGAAYGGRMNGVFRNPNGIGIFTALLGMLTVVVLQFKPALFKKQEKVIFLLLVIATLLFSGSRNAMVSLFLFLILARLNKASNLIGIISLVVIVTGGIWLYQNIESILTSLGYAEFFRLDTLDEASGRIFVWEAAWAEIERNFFWIGESFSYSETTPWMQKYYSDFPDLIYHQGNIHNSYLTFWMNTGLTGVLLFFVPLLGFFIKAMFRTNFALPLLVGVGFLAFFESFLIASLNPFTIIFYMILTLLLQGKDFAAEQKKVPLPPATAVA
jgi:O-antigen ligase